MKKNLCSALIFLFCFASCNNEKSPLKTQANAPIASDISIMMNDWNFCSTPENHNKDISSRCILNWYNPYEMVFIKDIYPDLVISSNESSVIHVLNLLFTPIGSEVMTDSWNGIMMNLPSKYHTNLSRYSIV